uniref:Uncharacterized protein n=1 Tax=Rhizophora mucronata TaxID=61149 RepID=A0A2P2NIK0_RHIMU
MLSTIINQFTEIPLISQDLFNNKLENHQKIRNGKLYDGRRDWCASYIMHKTKRKRKHPQKKK